MSHAAVALQLDEPRRVYLPGETLAGQYRLEGLTAGRVRAVELSVLWYTEGKGDEDLAVHFFERWRPDRSSADEIPPRRFSTALPASPLSYDGLIVKIRWCARLRVEVRGGKPLLAEAPFRLGAVPTRPEAAP